MNYKHIILILSILLSYSITFSQTFEEFKKKREKEIQEMKSQQKEAIQELRADFSEYLEKKDKEFAQYLKNEWNEFQVFRGKQKNNVPKPKNIPKYDPENKKEGSDRGNNNIIPQKLVSLEVSNLPLKPFYLPIIKKHEPVIMDRMHDIHLVFYGVSLHYKVHQDLMNYSVANPNNKTFSEAWIKLSDINISNLLGKLSEHKQNMNLNDWGLYQLVKSTAEAITNDKNGSKVLMWYLMNHMGYDTHIAYYKNKTTLLLPTRNTLYGKRFLIKEQRKYYILEKWEDQKIQTYTKDYPLAYKSLDMSLYYSPLLGNNTTSGKISFLFQGKTYNINIEYNKYNIQFYDDYPQTENSVYLGATVSSVLKSSLGNSLAPIIQNMETKQIVNFLLALVQKSFNYQTDLKQFGKEKFFFPEEVFHYSSSDCEDRSALFSWLIRNYTNLDIIGLNYPGHLATAVDLGKHATGSYIKVGYKHYTVADPTYINAPFGLVIPKFRNTSVKILNIKPNERATASLIWEKVQKAGAHRGSGLKDYAFDKQGNCYITGYYTNEIHLDGFSLNASKEKQAFIARFNPKGKVTGIKSLQNANSESFSYAQAIALTPKGEPIITGIFKGTLSDGSKQIESPDMSFFITKFKPNLASDWMNIAETKESVKYTCHLSVFDEEGHLLENMFFAEADVLDSQKGLFVNSDKIYLSVSMNNLTDIQEKRLASPGKMDVVDYIKIIYDDLIDQNTDPSVAGLIALIKLVGEKGYSVTGFDIQRAFDKYNRTFKQNNPKLYGSISDIKMLRYKNGIITVLLDGKKNIRVNKVKLYNDARLRVKYLSDGNQKVVMLSGFQVGKSIICYNLNSIKINKNSGNLIFDYDDDHTIKTVSMKNDILN